MTVIDTFINYADRICKDENVFEIYQELEKYMAEAELWLEQIGILGCLYIINRNPETWIKIGDIITKTQNNPQFAISTYSTYIKLTQPELYKNISNAFKSLDFDIESIEFAPLDDTHSIELEKLVNRHNAIIYMMVHLNKNNNFEEILALEKYRELMENKVNEHISSYNPQDKSSMNSLTGCKSHISELITKHIHNIELNELAAKLNPNNENAYINITFEMLNQNNIEQAMDFYNKNYAQKFELENFTQLSDLYWFLSKKMFEKNLFYETVLCQKNAIELELKNPAEV